MKAIRRNALLGAVFLTSLLSFKAAAAIKLAEYSKLEQSRRNEVLAAVVTAYYQHYNGSEATQYLADCMVELYRPFVDGAGPHLINLLVDELSVAQSSPQPHFTVEGIVQGVIERECRNLRSGEKTTD